MATSFRDGTHRTGENERLAGAQRAAGRRRTTFIPPGTTTGPLLIAHFGRNSQLPDPRLTDKVVLDQNTGSFESEIAAASLLPNLGEANAEQRQLALYRIMMTKIYAVFDQGRLLKSRGVAAPGP